jgi:HAD superfamily hydrolase (TIGR01509 family)
MIKAIIFDCFGVLYLPKSNYIYQNLVVNPSVHHDEIRSLINQNEYGLISNDELFAGIAGLTGMELEEVRRHLVHGFARNQELLDYTQQLRGLHKVGLLSNLGRDSMRQLFNYEELGRFFDAAVISGDVGMIKPHPEIYEYACAQLGVDVSEAVMVDDVEANCVGARQAGLKAVRYKSLVQLRPELEQIVGL